MTTHNGKCQERVREPGDWGGFHQCPRKGVVWFEHKLYCQQHNPPTVKAKSEARSQEHREKWEKEARDRAETAHRVDCYPELLAALEAISNAWANKSPLSWQPDGHFQLLEQARAAIANARPQTP